jgi:hypothetical protein
MSTATGDDIWVTRNLGLLRLFALLLLIAGVLGFVVPAELSLMSGAAPYNVFHLGAGAVAQVIVLRKSVRGAIAFNIAFGAIDVWQAIAGLTGLFPAEYFQLRPADHVLHVLFGALLSVVGWLGVSRFAVR